MEKEVEEEEEEEAMAVRAVGLRRPWARPPPDPWNHNYVSIVFRAYKITPLLQPSFGWRRRRAWGGLLEDLLFLHYLRPNMKASLKLTMKSLMDSKGGVRSKHICNGTMICCINHSCQIMIYCIIHCFQIMILLRRGDAWNHDWIAEGSTMNNQQFSWYNSINSRAPQSLASTIF